MATMSIGAVRKLHVFLLVTTMAVAVSSALPLSASDELQLEIPDGLTDSDLDQLSQLRRNIGDYDALDDETSRLILKLVDVAILDALERGASQAQTQSLLSKRGGLRKCFFHAINCW